MRKFLIAVLALSMVVFITACSSKEEDEVLDFHNDMIDELYPLYEKMDEAIVDSSMMATEEEIYEVFRDDLLPITDKMEAFFDEHDPETDIAREYYDLRKVATDYAVDYIRESEGLLGGYHDGSITEDEYYEQEELVLENIDKHQEAFDEADARWEEIIEEYDFKEIEE